MKRRKEGTFRHSHTYHFVLSDFQEIGKKAMLAYKATDGLKIMIIYDTRFRLLI